MNLNRKSFKKFRMAAKREEITEEGSNPESATLNRDRWYPWRVKGEGV